MRRSITVRSLAAFVPAIGEVTTDTSVAPAEAEKVIGLSLTIACAWSGPCPGISAIIELLAPHAHDTDER